MRVFLPSTLPALAEALRAGQVGANPDSSPAADPGPLSGYAVTPALRESYASGDEEELEYAALTAAARASLRLLADDQLVPVVPLAGPVAEAVRQGTTHWPVQPVLVSAHADDTDAGPDVRAAADALPAADAGDEDAQFAVDGAEGHELGWYATQELSYLAE